MPLGVGVAIGIIRVVTMYLACRGDINGQDLRGSSPSSSDSNNSAMLFVGKVTQRTKMQGPAIQD